MMRQWLEFLKLVSKKTSWPKQVEDCFMDLYGCISNLCWLILIYIVFDWFCIDLHWLLATYIHLCWFLCAFMYLHALLMCLWARCGLQASRRHVFPGKETFPDSLTMSILEIARLVRISIFMDVGTCLKDVRAEQLWILAVLRPPDLSPRPDWSPNRWVVWNPKYTEQLDF